MTENHKKIFVRDCKKEISETMEEKGLFGASPGNRLQGMTFYEFNLKDLGLPTAGELLEKINIIKDRVGLKGWCSNGIESKTYKGFSLTYNPDFSGEEKSIYHQTWGSVQLPQNYGRSKGEGNFESKNSYYDSYGFRKKAPIIEEIIGDFVNKFSLPFLRSRVAWHFALGRRKENIKAWHIDEAPYHILRINIPLQTSKEHVIDIVGEDEFGNSLDIRDKHLELGKAYIWNTRIPHCVSLNSFCADPNPRIHLVLGLCPWFDYHDEDDSFVQNRLHDRDLDYIIRNKLFVK